MKETKRSGETEVKGETKRLHEDPRSPISSCPARSVPAWLTGLPGSLITSRCAVAKPTGKIPPHLPLLQVLFIYSEADEKN